MGFWIYTLSSRQYYERITVPIMYSCTLYVHLIFRLNTKWKPFSWLTDQLQIYPKHWFWNCYQNFHKLYQSLNIWYQSFTNFMIDGRLSTRLLYSYSVNIQSGLNMNITEISVVTEQNRYFQFTEISVIHYVISAPTTFTHGFRLRYIK